MAGIDASLSCQWFVADVGDNLMSAQTHNRGVRRFATERAAESVHVEGFGFGNIGHGKGKMK